MFATILNYLTGGVSGGVTDVGASLGAFFGTITDGKLWRSVAWILLGVSLLSGGVILLMREPLEKAAGTVAKAAAL